MAIFRFFLIREKLAYPESKVFIYLYSKKCNFSNGRGLTTTSDVEVFSWAEVCHSLVSDASAVVIPPISLQLSPL